MKTGCLVKRQRPDVRACAGGKKKECGDAGMSMVPREISPAMRTADGMFGQ